MSESIFWCGLGLVRAWLMCACCVAISVADGCVIGLVWVMRGYWWIRWLGCCGFGGFMVSVCVALGLRKMIAGVEMCCGAGVVDRWSLGC